MGMRIFLSYLLLVFIGYLDYATGAQVRLGSLYLLAIAFAGWNLRPRYAILYAVIAVSVWIGVQLHLGLSFAKGWLVYWDSFNKVGSVAITVSMVLKAKLTLVKQRQLICELRKTTLSMSQYRELVPFCRICHKLHFDEGYESKLNKIVQNEESLHSVGDVCPACLEARVEHLENIPVASYFEPSIR